MTSVKSYRKASQVTIIYILSKPVIDAVQEKCLLNYNPHQNTSIDEAMVKFRGRLAFRHYMPGKPTKYGIKVWVRADPANGYTNEFQVYTGKVGNGEVGLAHRVIRDLSYRIRNKYNIVNMDNFFSSPSLCEELVQNGTYVRGTVRPNRKDFPQQLLKPKKVKKKQDEFNTAQKGEITARQECGKRRVVYSNQRLDDPRSWEYNPPNHL